MNGFQPGPLPAGIPKTTVLVGSTLVAAQRRLASGGSTDSQQALARLVQAANGYLSAGPWSVTDKQTTPPSGDKHDYMSQAPYYWPADATNPPSTPGTPGDCSKGYYANHDGVRNTREVDPPALTDHENLHSTIQAIFHLALAWFYTGDVRYAARAELFARHWFLDPATAMNPNLNYAQGIPCQPTSTLGRSAGIVDISGGYVSDLVDGLAILDVGAPGWTPADQAAMRAWLSQFLTWLTTMQTMPALADPIPESHNPNNHGSWYQSSAASLGAYLGKASFLTAAVIDAKARIDESIDSAGAMYRELARTWAWHYSIYNATALCRLAETARQSGANLWSYTGTGGGSLALAMNSFIGGAENGPGGFALNPACNPPNASQSAATMARCSPTQVTTVPVDAPGGGTTSAFDQAEPFYDLHAAAAEAMDAKAAAALPSLPVPGDVDMWSLIPSCRIPVAPIP